LPQNSAALACEEDASSDNADSAVNAARIRVFVDGIFIRLETWMFSHRLNAATRSWYDFEQNFTTTVCTSV